MFVATSMLLREEPSCRLLLRFHGIAADSEHMRHHFGTEIGVQEMVRCGKAFGLKARAYHSSWRRLIKKPGPGISVLCDGGYLMFGKANEAQVLVQNPLLARPILMSRAEFEAVWGASALLAK